jgi:uncharacterized protein YjiK
MRIRSTFQTIVAAILAVIPITLPVACKAAAFTRGNLVVYRVGTGAAALSNASAAVFLDEYSAAGTLVQSIPLPTADSGANQSITASGSATSGGLISRSSDGQYVIVTGYDTIPGVASITGSATTSVTRVIGRVAANGAVDSSTTTTSFSADNIRGATSVDGTAFWASGANTGIIYQALGGSGAGTIVSSSVTNNRSLGVFGGQLYVSSGSGTNTFRGVNAVGTGLPTTTGQTTTRLPGINDTDNPSSYQFFFADLDAVVAGNDTLYIADDGAGALTKWSLVGGTWTKNNTIGTTADDYRGLTGSVTATTVTLYATRDNSTGADTLVSLVDATGYNAAMTASPTLVATAGTNTAFRGVALAPVEIPQLIVTEINSNATGGDFWELTNVGVTTQDIGNWKWDDDSANPNDPAAVTIPSGTMIAPGESIVLTTAADAAAFRAVWSIAPTVQVIATPTGPSFGQGDQVHLFNTTGATVTSFSYAASGFTKSDGSAAAGGHAGASAGGTATQSAVIDPAFGFGSTRRFMAVTGTPGTSGLSFGGGPSITLSLNFTPSTFSESATNPASTGTVSRATSGTSDLVVNLSSSDTTEATVPATVTILANQTSANFDVTAVNDTFPDGSKSLTISASAADATTPTASLTVQDDGDVLDTSFLLTEVLSQQAAVGVNDFWELTNISAVTKDISGYSWHDNGRSGAAAAVYKLPPGSSIAPGESVIFTALTPAAFRAWWGSPTDSVQVFQTVGAPGLGQNDGVSFFDSGGNELFFFNYAVAGFTKADGNPSTGTHAGPSAGASTETQSAIWVSSSGTTSPRYTFAAVNYEGAFASAASALDIGSPGLSVGPPTVSIASASTNEGNSGTTTLALNVTRSDIATAFTVDYAVTGGDATSGTDYVALANGTLTFTAAGAATQPINITVNGDTLTESNETIVITLSNVVNTTGATILSNATGTGTVINDDIVAPAITAQPSSTTIVSGYATTLSLTATGLPAPTIQWYQGTAGTTTTPVGTNSSSFTTPVLTTTTDFWARVTNTGGSLDSATATVTVTAGVTAVDLSTYVRVARYNLPEYRRTALPPGTPVSNLLCDEASGVTYNWDTDTLFICGDGGRAVTQITKTGQLVDTMSLALNAGNPQGTEFYDPEGITYIGGGQFVFSEERERRLVKFTYAAGTTLTRAAAQTVDIGTFDDNTGTEGLSYDPQTSGFIVLKEKTPIGVFQTGADFNAGTATNGSSTTVNSTNLFDTTLLGMTDVADVFAFSNIPSMIGQPQSGNLLIIGQENARILNVDRTGTILSTLNISSDPGNPLSAADQQHEGITMDRAGIIYVVNENGGGSIEFPQLWVYAPSNLPNQAPTAITLNNAVNSLEENTSTASPIKVADIVVIDDGLGTNTLSLTGADAASFQLTGSSLFVKSGIVLDFETKTSYAVTINADDTTVGTTPDATVNFALTITDQVVETPAPPALIITEVAPWASSNGAVGGDWFEVTNVSASAVDITGWKVDDSSNAFATAIALTGITSIAPGESVIFLESTAVNQATIVDTFKSVWFGASPPSGLQVGTYQGSGIGLSTGADAVNLFTAGGTRHSGVSFGAADVASPFQTFDNTAAANDTAISLLSSTGVNGAFIAATSAVEIGSPGYSAPGVLRITETAPWSSGNSPVAADWFEVTNIGARAVNITGWKVDDSSESPAAALPLTGITSIAPGESVVFIETATLTTTKAAFLSNWFGASPPTTLQIGAYTGGGIGLSTGGDAVNLYDTNNVRVANVSFGIAPSAAPFTTFDNAAGLNVAAITTFSSVGVNGAFVAANSSTEIGSPGVITGGLTGFALWLSQNGYTGTLGGDTDNDGIPDSLEYFFNASPNNGGDRANLPSLVVNGNDLEFRFTYFNGAAYPGYVQCSEDLINWVNATSGVDYEVITETVNGNETAVRFRIFCNPLPTTQGPFTYLTPFTAAVGRGTIDQLTITNHGMVGAGRLSGDSYDSFGETMGAASGLSITGWSYNAGTGQFNGTFNVLPDRGYNSGAIFSNYAARVHQTPFTFTPYYGAGPVAQTQIVPTYGSTTKFTYLDGATTKFTTGLNTTGISTIFGQSVGTVTAANGPGGAAESLISFDAEAIHVFPDDSGFVSDEYGTYICRFNSSKQFTRIIQLPVAAQPHKPVGTLNFDSATAPLNGRRNNQGLEGMAVSPDNSRLFALMQSALIQDGGAAQTRYNTRLFVYDIAGLNLENPVLIAEHAVQLPRYDLNGNGSGLDATAAQSEIVALSNTQILMLPRDGNGLGKGTTDPIVTKTVDLVDFSTATNVLGLYDAEGNQISPSGTLRATITPAKSTVVVNLLSSADLAKFGFNTNTTTPNSFTVNEKAEGMALVPDTSTASTEDYFLFIANDNDFQSSDVRMVDATGTLVSYGDARDRGITNDAVFTAWRITICPNNRKFFRIEVDTAP